MKTIVFLGSHKSGSSYEAIAAADGMGYYTVLLTDRPPFIEKRIELPHAHSVRLCRLNDLDAVREALDRLAAERFSVEAVVSFIDPHCHTAAVLSREYGLKGFTETAIAAMLDKVKSRELLAGTPYSPFYCGAGGAELRPLKLPIVLKAPVSTGSKDVYLATTAGEVRDALEDLRKEDPDAPVLAEGFVRGPQYLAETLTAGGKVQIIAVAKQEIIFTGRFIITGYKMLLSRKGRLYRSLKAAVESIIQAHGLSDGPCHLELRRFKNRWKLIEANPRISGGAMNAFIQTAYGLNPARETLKLALGLEPDLEYAHKKEAYLQYVVVPRGGVLLKATGKALAQNSPGVEQVYIKPRKGQILVPPRSMGHRYAYVIATGASAAEAEKNAKSGAREIKFHLRAPGGPEAPCFEGLDNFWGNIVICE
jgi:biotin carboxylase